VLALVGERPQLREQARLADTRLAVDRQPPGTTGLQGVERVRQLLELTITPDEWPSAEVV
jgi:lipopolysaccharide/colanic/teichoic acid biosynthesis glycosyltransferase